MDNLKDVVNIKCDNVQKASHAETLFLSSFYM